MDFRFTDQQILFSDTLKKLLKKECSAASIR